MEHTNVLKKLEKENKIKIAVTDIDGILRGKYIHKQKFLDIIDNSFGFCDVIMGWDNTDTVYNNAEVTGWHTGFPDTKAQIDVTSYRSVPWQDDVAFFLADLNNPETNQPHPGCSRSLLKKVVAKSDNMGFKAVFAQEFEWFNFKRNESGIGDPQNAETITNDMFGYSLLRLAQNHPYVMDLFNLLDKYDLPLEGLHTETGPGVYEAAILKQPILKAADNAILFKAAVKEIASMHGFTASFMAKWRQDLPGCSGHIHQSLWDENNNNLFYAEDTSKLPEILQQYIAGQLYCLPYIMPMYAPTINSYKRLVDGSWAPNTATWSIENRTVALRYIKGAKKSQSNLEMRIPGSDSNAYLAMAASLASGLYGIDKKLKLEDTPVTGNAYLQDKKLANNLYDASQLMKNSDIAKELFGEAFVKHFCFTREWECEQYNKQVSNWELNRYFEII